MMSADIRNYGKDRIGVLFGGRSQEHEISVLSAAALMDAIDRDKHEVVPVGIGKDGRWYIVGGDMSGLRVLSDSRMERLIPRGGSEADIAACPGARPLSLAEFADCVDFVFPTLHGPFGEDGTVQGLFEMMGIPYAGCGVCASAVSMDKIIAKELLSRAGISVLPYTFATEGEYGADTPGVLARIEGVVDYPVYVKPANMGSSVGVRRAGGRHELAEAIGDALRYDRRVLVEEESSGRELEAAVLGNDELSVGAVGEIMTGGGFYDYDTKYRNNVFGLSIPAGIPKDVEARIKDLTIKTFKTLDGAGFARVDFFYNEDTGVAYVNEMNTIPGFTQYSMFPQLWEAAGVDYRDLIEKIIELGYERHPA
ncbi:MAG: D-alanine--D-alanine ligase [Clostridiales Family XIII bacterium]|jgi:D-alanine-D-alanine ligase|nr:D-alanine--D-alanine ligase [Clostridiales Family XIII bacterium]